MTASAYSGTEAVNIPTSKYSLTSCKKFLTPGLKNIPTVFNIFSYE